ncbi:Uncharacterised protein [Mycobacteroides abscessus subsp. abscessus]|nr:Uncharacterised protein [Mycobacteroides abscessus subsp. abscessus]
MAILPDSRTASKDHIHINHRAFAYNRSDIDGSTHHDYCIVPDFNLIPDNGTRLDPRLDVFHVKQWDR